MSPDPFLLPNPYFRFRLTPNTVQTIKTEEVLESAKRNVGARTEFEKRFALFVNARDAFGLYSGRASLRLALKILVKSRNFEVIIPTFVCGAVADAVLSAGGTPVLCDVKPIDGNIDPSKIKPCITDKTKAIVAVHYQGLPCDIDEIKEIGESYSVPVIEDCAHAIGSKFRGKPLGSYGDFVLYSFGPDKPITTGNGGMLTVNSKEYQEELTKYKENLPRPSDSNDLHVLRLLLESSLLMNYRTYAFFSISYFPAVNVPLGVLGLKPSCEPMAISNVAAKMGIQQLKLLKWIIPRRIGVSKAIEDELSGCDRLQLIKSSDQKNPVFLRYTVLAKSQTSRERLMRDLKRVGVESGPINWRNPLHLIPYYSGRARVRTSLIGAEHFSSQFLNLPCHPYVTQNDIFKIGKCAKTI